MLRWNRLDVELNRKRTRWSSSGVGELGSEERCSHVRGEKWVEGKGMEGADVQENQSRSRVPEECVQGARDNTWLETVRRGKIEAGDLEVHLEKKNGE